MSQKDMEKPRLIDYQGHKLSTCPNGCPASELELGRDQSSFMAMVGEPYKYIRCGKCGFGEENKGVKVKLRLADAISVWNETCSKPKEQPRVARRKTQWQLSI